MSKISFIGCGSYGFTLKLVADIFEFVTLRDSEFAFMDVDSERLDNVKIILEIYFKEVKYEKKVKYTLDLEEALEGADFVFDLVKIGFFEASEKDMDIPKKYGLYQTIGDTGGVAGIFRGLRTMVHTIKLCALMEKVASKKSIVINYTNPQAMLVMIASATGKIPYIGLCHSVQETTRQIARYMDIPYHELSFEAAGINHINWITRLERNGQDIYPEYRDRVAKKGIYTVKGEEDQVQSLLGTTRLDMLLRTGYMVTESSQHFSEYVPYYTRTKELREKYGVEVDIFRKNIEKKEKNYKNILENSKQGIPTPLKKSVEYGSAIINSMVTGLPSSIYANVMNHGLVTNLPAFCAVEVLSIVDKQGVHPCYYGKLPTHLAALCQMQINVQQLAVEAILNKDRQSVLWALMADPATHSILDLDQMEKLSEELLKEHEKYTKGYLS